MKTVRILMCLQILVLLTTVFPRAAQQQHFSVSVIGKGNDMILIPGLSCPGEVWKEVVEHYQTKYRCHVLSLPGFAGTKPMNLSGGYCAPVVREIADYIKDNQLKKVVLVGHSLGGVLSLQIAAANPGLVDRLVIVDSLPFPPAIMMPMATPESMKPMAEGMRKAMSGPDGMDEGMLRGMMATMSRDAGLVETLVKWSKESDHASVSQAFYELYTNDLRAELKKIDCPILVLGAWAGFKPSGATRENTLPRYQEQYKLAPKVAIEMTDIGYHFIMWDDPTFFFQRVDSFLK